MNEQTKMKPVSEILKQSWELYKKHFNVIVPIMLIAGIGAYLQTILLFVYSNDVVTNNYLTTKGSYEVTAMSGTNATLVLVAGIIYAVGMIWGMSALLNRVNKINQPMTIKEAFMTAKPLLWPLFITGLIAAVFTLIGFILLIIPGIIIGVWYSLSGYVVVSEHKSGIEALKASKAYVKGYWWPVFGRMFAIGFVIAIISTILATLANLALGIRFGTLVQDVVSFGLIPLAILYQFAVYENIKQIKNGGADADYPTPVPIENPAPAVPSTPSV